ncbi:Hypp4007 [Branchiostoma lanceolatum]|uniref:Hypp4007 protein n=1 Tax=Branchiostoma lanceolatum TaxID=7740 RepID=A0A8K0A3Y9_BRALA|nr:Hypp4007 [Branchiostoma lanceolatum]
MHRKLQPQKEDFPPSVKTIAAFLEKELTDDHLARIVGDWKNHFSAEESAKFEQKYRKRMAGSGLEFEFE